MRTNGRQSSTDGIAGRTDIGAEPPAPKRHCRRWLLVAAAVCATLLPLSLTIHAQQETQKAAQPAASQAEQPKPKTIEEDRLGIVKADIKKELEEYRKIRQEIEEMRKAVDKDRQEQQLKVAKMYESMQPEDAARRLEKIDEESALVILTTLKPKAAGKILAQMDTEKAAALSRRMLKKPKS